MSRGRISGGERTRRKRELLYRADPHCHWCGVETVLTEGDIKYPPDNMATFDHLISRIDQTEGRGAGVLACFACNQRRGKEREMQLTSQERAIRTQQGKRWQKRLAAGVIPADILERAEQDRTDSE